MNNFKFRGFNQEKNYFEGWYVKLNDTKNNDCYVFILGITLYEKDPHAFIQIIDSNQKISPYYRYSLKDFKANKKEIAFKDNILGINELKINVDDFKLDVKFTDLIKSKNRFLNNSIMGYFKYLPLPTKHEIIFLNSLMKGTIIKNGKKIDLIGTAYMEKTMGNRFPEKWIWIQANNFVNKKTSFVGAIADILCRLKGFFCILNIEGFEYKFTTYNSSKVKILRNDEKQIEIRITKDNVRLDLKVNYKNDYLVTAPLKNGKMRRVIGESINSTLEFNLYEDNKNIASDISSYVGCENLYK